MLYAIAFALYEGHEGHEGHEGQGQDLAHVVGDFPNPKNPQPVYSVGMSKYYGYHQKGE